MSNTNIKSRTFVYLRRSQDREDRQSYSIEKQDAQVKQIIRKFTLEPIYLPAEERSAKFPGRPIFDDMMDRIEKGEARYITVWALSRLSRNPVDGAKVIFAMDRGLLLAIYTPTRTYRNTPDDKMMLQIELAFAKKNNDDLSVQVKEGFETKRDHGQYPGPGPLGYINSIINAGERNIVPDPQRAPKVTYLFQLAATDLHTLHSLWLEAQAIGLLSRNNKVLGKQTIAEMLQRRTYTGVFRYGGEAWCQGTYPPLISVELFEKVQVAMGWVKSTRTRPATTSGREYPYKGLLMCRTCKFNVTAYTKSKKLANGTSAEYVFYTCTKKSKRLKCTESQVSDNILIQEIRSKMSEFQINEEEALECRSWLKELYADHIKKKNQYRPVWLGDQQSARKTLDVLDEKLEAGTISDERYKSRAAVHEATLARTTELLNNSIQDAERWLELATELFDGVVNIGDIFEAANDKERQRLMMFVGSNWFLANKKVVLTPRKPLHLLHISCRKNSWRARPDSNRRSPP